MVSIMKIERVKKDWSQQDLSALTGIGQWRLSLIERGLVPSGEEAEKISRVLENTVENLFPALVNSRSQP